MCEGSVFDTRFTMDEQLIGTRHIFRGFTDTIMFWNASGKIWHLELYHDKVPQCAVTILLVVAWLIIHGFRGGDPPPPCFQNMNPPYSRPPPPFKNPAKGRLFSA
jgi:hypothetical protein